MKCNVNGGLPMGRTIYTGYLTEELPIGELPIGDYIYMG